MRKALLYRYVMRIEQTFTVDRPPEAVFDCVIDPANLSKWQTTKTEVEVLNGDLHLATLNGNLVSEPVAAAHGLSYTDPQKLLR